ncbi:MAG: helix-turn-helix transcriptional regulator [Clostridium fessum]
MAIDKDNTQTGLIALLGDICKETKKILEVSVTIGVGESCSSLTDLSRPCHTALNALGYRAITGSGGVICIGDMEPSGHEKLRFDSRMESELIAAVKFGPKEKIRSVIDGIVSRMEDARVHYCQYQAYVLAIINVLTQLSQQYDLRISEMFGVENDYFEILGRVQKMENVRPYLTEVALKMNAGMEEERSNTTKNVIREAKQYIQDNFQDPDLSVEKICRHLHMSPAYFSTMFKKETGQAYIAYLTDVRLGRAVELLMATDDKTYIIAEKVGYPEQNYFSYVFKKNSVFPRRGTARHTERGGIMGKKRTIWKKKLFDDASIRSMIFIYFTITALAASVLISLSLYQRMSRQVTEVVQEESQNLIAQVGRSVESYLRTIMKLSDSLYYGTIKNADLSSQSLGSEFTLLYDNNKDNVENIALFSEDGALWRQSRRCV